MTDVKYRYYVVDTKNTCISSTNDREYVDELRNNDRYFIIDTELNIWLDIEDYDREIDIKP